MKRTPSLSLLAVALVAVVPTALAGTQDDPEIVDPALDSMPPPMNAYADITKAWFEAPDAETLRLHIELSFLPPEDQPALAYGLIFEAGNRTWFGAYVSAPFSAFFVGPWGDDDQPGDMIDASGAMMRGPGAQLSVDFPVGLLPPEAAHVSSPRAVAADIKLAALSIGFGSGVVYFDEGVSDATFALPPRESAPAAQGEPASPAAAAEEVASPTPESAVEQAPAEPAAAERAEVPAAPAVALAATLVAVAMARARRH